jgi:hypothetical protein
MNRTSKSIAIALTLAGLAGAPLAFAQNDKDAKQPAQPNGMQEMMQGTQGGGMGMMPTMNMMTQMNQMAATCNQMMQTMLPNQEKPAGEEKQPNKG